MPRASSASNERGLIFERLAEQAIGFVVLALGDEAAALLHQEFRIPVLGGGAEQYRENQP